MAWPARSQQSTPPAGWRAVLVTTPGLLGLAWTARAAWRKPEVAPAGEVVTEASLAPTWRPLIGNPVVRRTWAAWPASSRRRDLAAIAALDVTMR